MSLTSVASQPAALPYNSIGNVLAVLIILGVVIYVFVNIVFASRKEIGSEIEVAANRKPYLDDEQLEGPKLDRTLTVALITLFLISISLPLYWILEPDRQSGAAEDFGAKFEKQGAEMFAPTGDNLNALGCADCHGGMKATGGAKEYNLSQPDGTIKAVNWKAPALDTVMLRYSREEVTFILTYGRPFSPMPAWGVEGGGPLNPQQVQNLVDYLESIQIPPEQAQQEARDELAKMMTLKNPDGTPLYSSEGEALFNMGLTDGFAGGAYACGRCHTQKWSYSSSLTELQGTSGCGAFGPSLCNGASVAQFPSTTLSTPCRATAELPGNEPVCELPYKDHVDFVTEGSENGKKYGTQGQGSGKMPGFGERTLEEALYWIEGGAEREPGPGMLPPDLIQKIVEYERSL